MSTSDSKVTLERDGALATITLNRPDKFNALDGDVFALLHEAVREVARDESVRAVCLTGKGKAFCAGGDLGWMVSEGEPREEVLFDGAGAFHDAISTIRRAPKPVVAAIQGTAAGGGMSLAMACDLRTMVEGAYLRMAYLSNGMSIDGGGTWTLPRLVGLSRAAEIAMLDEPIPAETARRWGLVNRVYPPESFEHETRALLEKLAEMPTGAIERTKKLLNRSFDNSMERQLEAERRHIARQSASEEGREGMSAFLEKRDPDFT